MKLRYIKNLYWYDGPVLELWMDDGHIFYLSTLFKEKKISELMPKGVAIHIARKCDVDLIKFDEDGYWNIPKEFWEFKTEDDDFYLFDDAEISKERNSYDRINHLSVEAIIMSKHDKETLNYDFSD